jgi:hypothetical protein
MLLHRSFDGIERNGTNNENGHEIEIWDFGMGRVSLYQRLFLPATLCSLRVASGHGFR